MLLLLCLVATGAWGDVSFDFKPPASNGPGLLFVFVEKSITPKDYAGIENIANVIQKGFGDRWVVIAKLNSTGGNVTAALNMGRFLRKKDAMAVVEENAVCISSCVYVLAGASNRSVHGKVGIHRPYEPNDEETSVAAQKTKYSKIGKMIGNYLHAMNVPTRLYEDSLFISPDRVRILSFDELQAYGLNMNDPYADESSSVSEAKRIGISRREYAVREVRSRGECGLNALTNDTPKDELINALECKSAVLEGKR